MRTNVDARGRWLAPLGLIAAIALGELVVLSRPGLAAAAGTHLVTLQVRVHDAGHQVVSSVAAGSPVHLRVTVFADLKGDPIPTGQASVIYYTDGACATAGGSRSGTLANGSADPAGEPVFPARAGAMSFRASYGGDATFQAATSACVPLSVTPATPSISLRLERAGVEVSTGTAGQAITFRLTISGPAGVVAATGNAQIRVHSGSTCSSLSATTSGAVSNGVFTSSLRLGPGSYSVTATYAGDANWLPGVFAGCLPLTITKAPSTLVTTIHDAAHASVTTVDAGATVHPRVLLDSPILVPPTGIFRGRAYADAACTTPTGLAVDVPVVRSGSDGIADIPELTIVGSPGTHAFRVDYLGDDNFLPEQGSCTPYSVTGGTPTDGPPTDAPPTHPAPTLPTPTTALAPSATPPASVAPTAPTPSTYPAGTGTAPGATPDVVPSASALEGTAANPATTSGPGSSAASASAPAPVGAGSPAGSTGAPVDGTALVVAAIAILVGGLVFAGATLARRRSLRAPQR